MALFTAGNRTTPTLVTGSSAVGTHPIFAPLCTAAAEASFAPAEAAFLATQSSWDPYAFIDLCELAVNNRADCELVCRQVQQVEWQILFDYCYRSAVGLA